MEKEEEENYFKNTLLLENGTEVFLEIPENNYDEALNVLIEAIRTDNFFTVEEFGGSMKIGEKEIDCLNCKKVVATIY